MSFSFDFFAEEEKSSTPPATATAVVDEQELNDNNDKSSVDNAPSSSNKPFGWISSQELTALLQERCWEELQCQEIGLAATTTETTTTRMQDDEEDEDDDDNAQPQDILRFVDLTVSSFANAKNENNKDDDDDSDDDDQLPVVKTGVYEGGLQIWECSLDLVHYLHQKDTTISSQNRPFRILELGCGHALPSLYLLRKHHLMQQQGNSTTVLSEQQQQQSPLLQVILTDYNDHVLRNAVVSNLVLNAVHALVYETTTTTTSIENKSPAQEQSSVSDKDDENKKMERACQQVASSVQCAHGDWMGLLQQPQTQQEQQTSNSFDLILAAETCYTIQAARETAQLIYELMLQSSSNDDNKNTPSSMALIATKRYYFGVGGGTQAFCQALEKLQQSATTNHDFALQVETVHVVDNGHQNIREIIQVTRRLPPP